MKRVAVQLYFDDEVNARIRTLWERVHSELFALGSEPHVSLSVHEY